MSLLLCVFMCVFVCVCSYVWSRWPPSSGHPRRPLKSCSVWALMCQRDNEAVTLLTPPREGGREEGREVMVWRGQYSPGEDDRLVTDDTVLIPQLRCRGEQTSSWCHWSETWRKTDTTAMIRVDVIVNIHLSSSVSVCVFFYICHDKYTFIHTYIYTYTHKCIYVYM